MNEFRPSRFEILPVVIKNLIIINVLVFLAQNTIGNWTGFDMENAFGLHHVKSTYFQPWQIITHLFLHANFQHLLYNMFPLWMFGAKLESMWGPKRFLTFYILCGIGAALIQLIWLWFEYHGLLNEFVALKLHTYPDQLVAYVNHYGIAQVDPNTQPLQNYLADPDNPLFRDQAISYIDSATNTLISQPTIGASGAVFGVLAAFGYLFPNSLLYFYFLFPVKVKWFVLFYFGFEVFSAFQNNPSDNIAHWAHIGGGLVGFLLILTWNKRDRSSFY